MSAAADARSRRACVLAALKKAGEQGISGERLAADMGVSRVAVAKHIAALRDLGYGIDSLKAHGYVLRSVSDLPLPLEVAPLLKLREVRLFGGDETGSTNDDCKRLGLEGEEEFSTVLAARQSAGKGRLGRKWESPQGGLYLSMLFRPKASPHDLAPLSLVAGLGIVHGLEALGVSGLSLKWPNDVYLGKSKLCGILLEMSASAEIVDFAVAGIGTNVRRMPSSPKDWAYLDDAGCFGLARTAAAEIDGLTEVYARLEAEAFDFSPFVDEYDSRLNLIGKNVRVRKLDGSVVAQGEVRGVDSQARLLVGDKAVYTGEVTLR